MKPKLLGAIVCFLLRSHKWRRLRKAELLGDPFERICGRCGERRAIKSRKVEA